MQGSGGHTAEMLQLVRCMLSSGKLSGTRRVYVVAKTDGLSANKATSLEEHVGGISRGGSDGGSNEAGGPIGSGGGWKGPVFRVERIDRAREVGQSYLTSVVTTVRSFMTTATLVLRYRPGMVVVNGPGTCLPIVVWARVLVPGCRVYYVESIARVDHLSLTGKVLLRLGLVNGGFFVQWKELADKLKEQGCGSVVYAGRVY